MSDVVNSVLRDRLAEYTGQVSFEKGRQPDPLLTDGERGDLHAAEAEWGVPRGVLLLIDRMMTLISPAARVAFAKALSDAWPDKRDQSHVVGAFVLWMLADPTHGTRAAARNTDVVVALDAVIAAQRRTLGGAALARPEWSAVRRSSMAASDPVRDGRASHFAAQCAEAAAWPPIGSPSVGVQTLEPWSNIAGAIVDAEKGWTLADYDRLQAAMKTVFDASQMERLAGAEPDLDALMLAEDPDLTVRWEQHVFRTRALAAERMGAACDAIVNLLTGPLP